MKQRRGSIDAQPGGRFRVRFTGSDGIRRSFGTYNDREEAESARAYIDEVLAREVDTPGLTLGQYGETFLTKCDAEGRWRDMRSIWSRWNTHIKDDPVAKLAIATLKRLDVRKWMERMHAKPIAAQTKRNTLSTLSAILKEAWDFGVLKENPATGHRVKSPPRPYEPWSYLTGPQQQNLLEHAGRHRNVIAFAMGTGLRPGELVSLRLADVHEDHIVVRFGKPPEGPTKTGRVRVVPLFGFAREAAEAQKRVLAVAKKSAKPGIQHDPNPHRLLFPAAMGGYRDEIHVIRSHEWEDILVRSGILTPRKKGERRKHSEGRFRWYDLRHTAATALVCGWWGRRWTLDEVRVVLGHTHRKTTERYAHTDHSVIREAGNETPGLQLIGRALAEGGTGRIGKNVTTSTEPVMGIEPATCGLRNQRDSLAFLAGCDAFDRISADAEKLLRAAAEGDRDTAEAFHERLLKLAGKLIMGDLHNAVELSAAIVSLAKDRRAVATEAV